MAVLKVIVTSLPKGCKECVFAGDFFQHGAFDCVFSGYSVREYENSRHKLCPLMPECEVFNWIMHRAPTKEECESEE